MPFNKIEVEFLSYSKASQFSGLIPTAVVSITERDTPTGKVTVASFDPTEAAAKELWRHFGDTPVDQDDNIEEEFAGFSVGTPKYEVWRWFEISFDSPIVCLMGVVKASDLLKPHSASEYNEH